jgi:hypothetical protein
MTEAASSEAPGPSGWRRAAGPFILLLIVTGFFWKLLLTNQYSWLQSPDLAYQVVPWFQYQAVQFHQHVFPTWDPFHYGGQPLLGQALPGLGYPPNWTLYALPLRDGHINYGWLNWYFMLIHYFAALFSYLFCRDLGRGYVASIIGGVSFGLGGYVGNVDWPVMINGAIWGPLVFLFLFRVARGIRPVASAALSGLFLGVSWLSGHHQIPIFLSLAALAVWLFFLFADLAKHRRIQRSLLKPFGVFLVFVALSGALQMWPTFSYGRDAVRWVGSQSDPIAWNQPVPYTVHRQYSLGPRYLLGIVIPGYEDGQVAYVGMVALALAGLALARCWQSREVRVLFGVGAAGLFLALGNNNLFHGILYSVVPMFEKARTPSTAIYLFHFATAILISFGMDALLQASARPAARRVALIFLVFGASTFFIIFGVFIAKGQVWSGDDRVMITVLAAFALSGLLYRVSRSDALPHGLPILIVALYLVELGNSAMFYLPHKEEAARNVYLAHFDATKQVAEFLRRQPAPVRVWMNPEDVPFNFGDWYGIDVLNGFMPGIPYNVDKLEIHSLRGRQLYGAAYTISRKPLFADQTEVFRDANGLGVYMNPDVLPRVWTVHHSVTVKDLGEMRRHFQDPAFDIRQTAIFYKPPPALETCEGDEVRSFTRGVKWTTAVVAMKCLGMVVTSENNAPGWVAFVDGEPAPIYEAYTTLRGVIAGPGTHKIEMRYQPWTVRAGAAATSLAFVGGFLLWLAPGMRRQTVVGRNG